jgi:hypothetical protein
VFEQLGSRALETAVTVDIAGRKEAFATTLDAEAVETLRKERLHQKTATVVFFESNGGTTRTEATIPEIRLAVGCPELDLGNIETALDALTERCYYLTVERKNYKFSLKENLNKRFSDKRANIASALVDETIRAEIQKVFAAGVGVERVYFPEKTIQVADRPAITLVVLAPDQTFQDDKATTQFVETMVREYGNSARTFKSALLFSVPESADGIRDDARKLLAWEAIEEDDLKLDESQLHQLAENLKKARRDLKETVWRTYKVLMLLGKDNTIKRVDLGLIHSSAAADILSLILGRLSSEGDLESKGISPTFLIRNWPPAFKEWSTKSVRDAFFASPQFPKLTNPEVLKDTIVRGVGNGMLAYVGKTASGTYKPFYFNQALMTADVEFSEDMFIITRETAEAILKERTAPAAPAPSPTAPETGSSASVQTALPIEPPPASSPTSASGLTWTGEIPSQKWMNFYTKVLAKFASARGLKLTVKVEATPEGGVSQQKIDETKSALRELGLHDKIDPK